MCIKRQCVCALECGHIAPYLVQHNTHTHTQAHGQLASFWGNADSTYAVPFAFAASSLPSTNEMNNMLTLMESKRENNNFIFMHSTCSCYIHIHTRLLYTTILRFGRLLFLVWLFFVAPCVIVWPALLFVKIRNSMALADGVYIFMNSQMRAQTHTHTHSCA